MGRFKSVKTPIWKEPMGAFFHFMGILDKLDRDKEATSEVRKMLGSAPESETIKHYKFMYERGYNEPSPTRASTLGLKLQTMTRLGKTRRKVYT